MSYFCVKITQTMNSDNHTEGYTYKYPHPAVTTDCVVFGFDGKELKVLLIERGQDPYKGMWAFPGGFLRMDETAEECARRELKEETGLELTKVRELGSFSDITRDPRERVISIAYYSLARHSAVKGGDDAAKAKWWAIDDIPHLAFDHDYILRKAMKRIRQDIHFEPVGFDLLDEQFTIAELQRLYESILGVNFDRRNFYRKMLQTGVLEEVAEDKPQRVYFGDMKEMRVMPVDDLFGAVKESAPCPAPARGSSNAFILPLADEAEDGTTKATARIKRIHELLRSNPAKDEPCEITSAMMSYDDAAPERSRSVGRKGKLYRFNEEKYNRMKEDGNFRLEF